MTLSEKQIKSYQKMLLKEPQLYKFVECLSPTQLRFWYTVIVILDHPDQTESWIAKQIPVSRRTVCRALQIIRGRYIPFRVTNQLRSRLIAKQFGEKDTALGRMNENALAMSFSRLKSKCVP